MKIEKIFKDNLSRFRNELILFIDNNQDNFNSLTYYINFYNSKSYYQRNDVVDLINRSINNGNNFVYDEYNGLLFYLEERDVSEDITEGFNSFYIKKLRQAINEYCFDELSNNFLNFSCYEDIIVEFKDRNKILLSRKNTNYNYSGWIEFFVAMYKSKFSDFEIFQNKKVLEFKKKLGNNIDLKLVLEIKKTESNIKIGILDVPLLSMYYTIKGKEDIHDIFLGELHNPYLEMLGLSYFIASQSIKKITNHEYQIINQTKEEFVETNKIRFYNDEVIGDLYKKYAFMLMNIQYNVDRVYLNFIEWVGGNVITATGGTADNG